VARSCRAGEEPHVAVPVERVDHKLHPCRVRHAGHHPRRNVVRPPPPPTLGPLMTMSLLRLSLNDTQLMTDSLTPCCCCAAAKSRRRRT
jgi:hypothetical protein